MFFDETYNLYVVTCVVSPIDVSTLYFLLYIRLTIRITNHVSSKSFLSVVPIRFVDYSDSRVIGPS